MSKTPEGSIIVGLDIGTNKVSALVGEVLPDGQVSVIGSGSCPSRGMDKGGVNDLEIGRASCRERVLRLV